ncbi:proteasome subunit beta type-3 [Brevipalpus obovatus]|uniref:proteasome subunit beta type-3 n=1 Tax=Brevipalpus obovatus TaxID=246614 RepID=UPI003D9F5C88
MSIMDYNGGGAMAVAGKDCLVLLCDRRLGVKMTAISMNHSKIYQVNPHLYLLLPGLATDALTVFQKLSFRINMYELEQGRKISAKVLSSMVSNLLYEHRFGPYFVGPIVAGLDPETGEVFLNGMDLIGAGERKKDFVFSGHNSDQAMGTAEALWEPDMSPEHLFEMASQAFLSACDRDAGTGYGAIVYIVEKDKVTQRILKGRMD